MPNAEEIRMRNKPCPCGSGKKYRYCCAGKPQEKARRSMPPRDVIIAGVVLGGLTLAGGVLAFSGGRGGGSSADPIEVAQATNQDHESAPAERVNRGMPDDPDPRPAAWYFDAPNNRHWHEPHDHWHPGPPPPPSVRNMQAQQSPSSAAPSWATSRPEVHSSFPAEFEPGQEPPHLFFDQANNRHWWGPHNHWHPGPPPEDES